MCVSILPSIHSIANRCFSDILLPCCGEPLEILANTYKHIARLSYTNHRVHVLDDGGLDTVKQLAERYGFNYIRRENRGHLKKAGNLRHAFPITSGEFFTIFDADFCPRPDFLQETLPLLRESPDIAILQTPQFFRPCSEQTWVEQGASATQELFYRVSQVSRDYWGAREFPHIILANVVLHMVSYLRW